MFAALFENQLKRQRATAQIHSAPEPIGEPKIHGATAAAAGQIVVHAGWTTGLDLRADTPVSGKLHKMSCVPRGPWWFSQRKRLLRRYNTVQGAMRTKDQVTVKPVIVASPSTEDRERGSLALAPEG